MERIKLGPQESKMLTPGPSVIEWHVHSHFFLVLPLQTKSLIKSETHPQHLMLFYLTHICEKTRNCRHEMVQKSSKLKCSASGSFSNSHWYCHDASVCCNTLWWEGVERWLECRKVYTTQNNFSFALTQVPPWGCLATHVLLRKVPNWRVTAINITWDEQGLGVSIYYFKCFSFSLVSQLHEGR